MSNLYIVEREETRYDIRKMTADQLEMLEMALQGDITAIRDQMGAATARRWETGEYASADWFRRARTAREIKARQLEMVKRTRKAKREAERRSHGRAFHQYFMDAARSALPPDTFDSIMSAAVALQSSDTAGGER